MVLGVLVVVDVAAGGGGDVGLLRRGGGGGRGGGVCSQPRAGAQAQQKGVGGGKGPNCLDISP